MHIAEIIAQRGSSNSPTAKICACRTSRHESGSPAAQTRSYASTSPCLFSRSSLMAMGWGYGLESARGVIAIRLARTSRRHSFATAATLLPPEA